MDHQNLQRAHSSGQEGHGVHVCSKCGWPFPNAHPSARHRRVCGTVDGYELVDSTQHSVSDDDQHSDDDNNHDPTTPTPKVVERSVYEKRSGGIGQESIQSDDRVFADAVAQFSDSSSAARSGVAFQDARESQPDVDRSAEKDLSPIPFAIDGKTTGDHEPVIYTSEDMKKTNVTDTMIESCLTSVDQEVEVTGTTATNFMSDSKNEESNLGDSDGLHPVKKEMMTDASEIIEKTGDTDNMVDSCLTSVNQDAEVAGITATNLDRNMILTKKFSGESIEGVSKFEKSNEMTSEDVQDEVVPSEKEHSVGFDTHFPQVDVPPEVDSVALVDTSFDSAEKKLNNTDGIQDLNSGEVLESHNGKEDENANVHVLSVPDDLHVVEDPVAMLEDFKDHKGKQLDRFTSCSDSWEQFEDEETNVKQPIFNENSSMLESSRLSGSTVVFPHMQNLEDSLEPDDSNSKPMTKIMPDEGEVSMSQSEIKIKNHTSDEIGAPADASMPLTDKTYVVDFPEGQKSDDKSNEYLQLNFAASDAGIDQTTQSVGLGDKENNGIEGSGESRNDNKKGPGEEPPARNLIAIVQSTDFHDDQIYPGAKVQKDDDAGDDEDIVEEFNKFGDAGYNEKADTFNICGEETSKGAGEIFSGDPTSSLETVSSLSELQVNPVTILHEVGDCEKHKTEEFNSIGCDGDLEKEGKCASSGEDLSKQFTDKTFVEDPTFSVDSATSLSDSQVRPMQKLPDADGSADHNDGKVEKFFVSGNESLDGYVEENIMMKSDLTPKSSVTLSNDVVEDATYDSRMKMVKTSSRDLDICSDSIQIAGEALSHDQQDVIEDEISCSDKIKGEVDAHVAAASDHGQNVASSQKTLDDNEKRELGFSALDTKYSVQGFIGSQDSGSQEVPAVASGTSSQFVVEGGDDNLVRQQPSPTAIDVDSNSQTDSLEANWGSISVLSMQSDTVTVVEAAPRSNSQTSYEENSGLKKSIADCKSPYSGKSSDMFEAPSFMTLVEPRGADDKKTTGSGTGTAVQNPELPKPVSLQTGWFPSMTHVANESEGRKKNEEIIAKVTNWNIDKPHSPLKSLLGEASSKGKLLNQKESLNPAPQKDVTTTVNSILNPESPTDPAAKKEHAKEWNSPARYPAETKSEKKKAKGRPSWVQFVCCASVKQQ